MLVRCLYASRPSGKLNQAVVDSITEQSRKNNPRHGVTGILCFTENVFIQVLEGGRDKVCELYNKIVRDERHAHVTLLLFEEISERRFGSWTMGQVDAGKPNQAVVLKYSEKAELDPFASRGASVLALLNELIEIGAVGNRSSR